MEVFRLGLRSALVVAVLTCIARAASEVHVDMQPAGATTAAGYVGVTGANRWDANPPTPADLGGGVQGAWLDAFNGGASRDRTTYSDLLTRDFLGLSAGNAPETFQLRGVVPGNYDLKIYAVDPAYNDKRTAFAIDQDSDGVADITLTIVNKSNEYSKTVPVTVSPAGVLSITVSIISGAPGAVINGFDLTPGVPDTTPPAAIVDLAVVGQTASQVTLRWTAPSDESNGVIGRTGTYDVRYASDPIIDATWDAATQATDEPTPANPGQLQTFVVTGLSPSTTYHFAVRSADFAGNISGLSNVVAATTDDPDLVPPAAVSDLAATAVDVRRLTLTWTASGDDGTSGTASGYEIRYSTSPITDDASFAAAVAVPGVPAPKAAGSPESLLVTGLQPDTTYYFAMDVADEFGNRSGLSNVLMVRTLPPREAVYGISNEFSLEPTAGGPYEPAVPVTGDVSVTNIHVDPAAIVRTVQRSGPVYAGTIVYDVSAATPYVHVWLELSTDGGATWSQRRIHAVGAVGTIPPGPGKVARWLVDGDRGHHCRIRLRVTDNPATYSDLDADNNKYPRPAPWAEYPNIERLTDRKDFVFTDTRYELPKIDFYKSLSAGQVKAGFARTRFFHSGTQYLTNPMYFMHCCYLEGADGQQWVILQGDTIYIRTDMMHAYRDQIHAATGIPKDHIMGLYTHVHNGGDGVGGSSIFPMDVLQEAMANARPVEVGFVNQDMGTSHNTHRNLFTDATHATSSFSNYLYDPGAGRITTDVIWQYDALGNIVGGMLDGSPWNSPVQRNFDCPLDSYLQMIVFRALDTHEMTGVIVKFTVHPITRDYFGDYPRCVMDHIQQRFGANVEVMFTSGFASNHRPLAAQQYPASLGAPRSAAAFAQALADALPTMEFAPLRKLGMVMGYDLFGMGTTDTKRVGTDPDRLGVSVQVFRLNDIYLSTLPGEAPSEQGLYIRGRTSDTRHMYNAYGNSCLYYYTWGRWFDIGHYEGSAVVNRFQSFRMAQEIVRGVSILEKAVDELRLRGDIDGDGTVNVFDIFMIAEAWNTAEGDPAYNAACDLDGDGAVNVFDIFVIAENWNQSL